MSHVGRERRQESGDIHLLLLPQRYPPGGECVTKIVDAATTADAPGVQTKTSGQSEEGMFYRGVREGVPLSETKNGSERRVGQRQPLTWAYSARALIVEGWSGTNRDLWNFV